MAHCRQGFAAHFRQSAIAVSEDEPALGALLVLAGELVDAGLVEDVVTGQGPKVLDGVLNVDAHQADRAYSFGGQSAESRAKRVGMGQF